MRPPAVFFFFFNDTATTEIYTLSLHDALPICSPSASTSFERPGGGSSISSPGWNIQDAGFMKLPGSSGWTADRKSTRLNSSHLVISYAVFCLKKKKLSAAPAEHTMHMAVIYAC